MRFQLLLALGQPGAHLRVRVQVELERLDLGHGHGQRQVRDRKVVGRGPRVLAQHGLEPAERLRQLGLARLIQVGADRDGGKLLGNDVSRLQGDNRNVCTHVVVDDPRVQGAQVEVQPLVNDGARAKVPRVQVLVLAVSGHQVGQDDTAGVAKEIEKEGKVVVG